MSKVRLYGCVKSTERILKAFSNGFEILMAKKKEEEFMQEQRQESEKRRLQELELSTGRVS